MTQLENFRVENEALVSPYTHPAHPLHVFQTAIFFLVKVDTQTNQSYMCPFSGLEYSHRHKNGHVPILIG
jgi:hypothetical protein